MAEPRRRKIPMLRTGSTARSISEETDDSQSDSERYEDNRPAVYTFVEWVRSGSPSPPLSRHMTLLRGAVFRPLPYLVITRRGGRQEKGQIQRW